MVSAVCLQGPVGSVSRLSEFLGVGASPELCAKVAEATSFDRLKAADRDKQQPDLPPAQLYRKGKARVCEGVLEVPKVRLIDVKGF